MSADRNLESLIQEVFNAKDRLVAEQVAVRINDIRNSGKTFQVQPQGNDIAAKIFALLSKYVRTPHEEENYVATLLKIKGHSVSNPKQLSSADMAAYLELLADLYFAREDGSSKWGLPRHIGEIAAQLRREAQIQGGSSSARVEGGASREIEVQVKVDMDLFDTFKGDYDNRVLYKKASRLDLVNKIINALLQSNITPSDLSYEQCNYLVSMFDILKTITTRLRGEEFKNEDIVIPGQIDKIRELVEQGVRKGFLTAETEAAISKEIERSDERAKLDKVPEQDQKWFESMRKDLEIREEIFSEVIRKITIIVNMITLRFVSREMAQRDRQFYQDYENRVHAINAYLYADLVEVVNADLREPGINSQLKSLFEQKCKNFLVFMNCVKQIDLAIQLCAQKEIQAPERLRVTETGTARQARSETAFREELEFLERGDIAIDDAKMKLETLVQKNIDTHVKHMSRLREIFEIFLDIVNQIVDEGSRQKFELVLGTKVKAEDLAKVFDQFLVSMSIAAG